ncbi:MULTISPECIES: ribonuclease HI [Blattabacterium]|uniref:ribonuclease H n=1 Tax=Blattabacterium punctulatus TaxID=164514 RepID=A0ABN5M2T5_9FLAO|nr:MULTISPECIES: ribonuclease H [Blattabacterium]AEU09515.1 ribonuclease HI [Blattabacterium sp. (Cryptocercus punctulatus) str. Cpu]AWU39997.1 ribonuclease HI [Blattabacterium punctulatus]AWU40540.1 ribonuclease HI [Blattabacterium punctulatus]AWU42789.1 ribonuclease HI [Blattabacterium punctulatus]AWU44446.1 ribonuclease HI [Blattabacterium punctulatus]
MNKKIHIYTDGSSKGNPGPGGYAIFIEIAGTSYWKIISEGFRYTTNNRMELLAIIVGLEKITKKKQNIIIFTDSKYIINSIQKNWIFKWKKNNFKKKKNVDLWIRFLNLFHKHFIIFQWVKGHYLHYINDYCDRLSVEASKSKKLKIDHVYEKENLKKTI